jgi:hypothetical protein
MESPNEITKSAKENKINIGVVVIDRLKQVYKVGTDSELGRYLGISTSTISSWKIKGTIDYHRIFATCPELNRNFIVDGEKPVFKKEIQMLYEELEKKDIENEKQEAETRKYMNLAHQNNEGKDEKIKIYRKRITQMQSKIETLKEVINSIVKQIGESKTKETSSKAPLD